MVRARPIGNGQVWACPPRMTLLLNASVGQGRSAAAACSVTNASADKEMTPPHRGQLSSPMPTPKATPTVWHSSWHTAERWVQVDDQDSILKSLAVAHLSCEAAAVSKSSQGHSLEEASIADTQGGGFPLAGKSRNERLCSGVSIGGKSVSTSPGIPPVSPRLNSATANDHSSSGRAGGRASKRSM